LHFVRILDLPFLSEIRNRGASALLKWRPVRHVSSRRTEWPTAELAEQHQLKPLLAEEQFGHSDIARAYDAVAKGSKGKVVLEL
jgi:hypothetical protein